MSMLVQCYVIYNAHSNTYINDGSVVTLNCDRINAFTPRPVWLQRWLPAGDGTDTIYQLTFNLSSLDQAVYGTNLIQGFYVEQDGQGIMVDVLDLPTLLSACDACCGGAAGTLPRFYSGGIPNFTSPTEVTYCISRLDDGSAYAHNQLAGDYANQFHGNALMISQISGVSRYRVSSFSGWPPVPQGSDTIILGTCS